MKVVVVVAVFATILVLAAHAAQATQPEYIQIDPKTKKPVGKPVTLGDGVAIVGGTIGVAAPPMGKAVSVSDSVSGAVAAPAGKAAPKTLFEAGFPYVPQQTDYAIEIGVWQARDPSLWLGALIGEHVGRCVFTDSQTCQQYLDLIGAAVVREGETYGLFQISPRWQFVNFPDRASPFFRLFAGPAAVSTPAEQHTWKPAGGVGIGVTTYLHEHVDLRAELRAGVVDRGFVVGLLAANVKTDRLLEYFAKKLRDLGVGTVKTAIEATGTVIKATGEGVGGAVESLTPNPTPTPAPAK